MKRESKMCYTMALAFLFVASAFMIMVPAEEIEVEAAQSPTADAFGYSWVDNQGSDPRVDYEWIDITGVGKALKTGIGSYSTYRYRPYQITQYEKLGFDFPYYGETYTEIQVWPNGVLGFGTAYSYSYYNYGGAFPSVYTYTPYGTIAPYWVYYGGPLLNDPNSDIWVYQDVTADGMKCWICSWVDVTYYGTSAAGGTFQVILYENGNIKANIKESQTYTSSYVTVGIQNYDRSVGTSYSYARILADFTSILFKQFMTDLSNVTFKPGYGPDENIYPAQCGDGDDLYWVSADVWIETNVGDLQTIDVVIGPGTDTENIILRYNFAMQGFQKVNDAYRLMYFDPDRSAISYSPTAPNNNLTVKFYFDFNLNWMRLDLIDVELKVVGRGVAGSKVLKTDVFRVENRLKMEGNVSVTDFKGRELNSGAWVKGGDSIVFSGIVRKYADPSIPIAPPDLIKIGIEDESGNTFMGATPDLMGVEVYVPPLYNDMEYRLVFINVTEMNDMSDQHYKGYKFLVQIDTDKPGLPGELLIRPDSFSDQSQNYDDDPEVYLSWKDAVDQSSGVALYHISLNMDRDEAYAKGASVMDIPKGTLTARVDNLEEGVNTIYIWAEDSVGNEGNSLFIDVIIDMAPVYFTDFYPTTGVWINNLRPLCSIVIHDDLTGVNPLTIEYEFTTSGETGLVGEWSTISDPYAASDELRVAIAGWFKNGKDNWIRFRARDMAGNPHQISESYNVWIDARSPTYKMTSHSEDEYQLNPLQEVHIQIQDDESWVDASTIEYRITTQGLTKWSAWLPYKDAEDGQKSVVTLRENFRRGNDNYIQVRAKDLAGNPVSVSKAFNIRINTYPVIVIVSPTSSDLYRVGDTIVFDAGDSYDPDGDRLTISWFKSGSDGMEPLGESQQVTAKLPAGEHTITVIAKDRVNNQVQTTFTLTVELAIPHVVETDLDGDGLPDWWEEKYQTDPAVKDAQMDPDHDGFTNLQEFQNSTHPNDPRIRPPTIEDQKKDNAIGLFSSDAWPLWVLLLVLVIAVVLTMFVAKAKKDRQVKRIQTVRNMRKIMPSVSWDQITATAYLAPMTGGMTLPAAAGPALPSAAQETIPPDQALPPAPESAIRAGEVPAPEPTPAPEPIVENPPQ
ncbi:MAG: hypothetical protein JXA22_00285 [Candidatus Thermoplasmatota archaeon]|nr:hypothetical protein [Candidatus Thermoplasmatota archaeon]